MDESEERTFTNTVFCPVRRSPPTGRRPGAWRGCRRFAGAGHEDLFITTLVNEGNSPMVNGGSGFQDKAPLRRSHAWLHGFGAAGLDFDNDGRLDVLTVNGAVRTIEALAQAGDPFPLHQRKQLFRNLGGGRFEEVSSQAGAVFDLSEVGRGAAFGDIDNDGDTDVVVANNNGRARLLINQVGNRNHWIGLRLVGKTSGPARDLLGARAAIVRKDGSTVWRRARADGSYAGYNDPRIPAGLTIAEPARVRVVYPMAPARSGGRARRSLLDAQRGRASDDGYSRARQADVHGRFGTGSRSILCSARRDRLRARRTAAASLPDVSRLEPSVAQPASTMRS